MVEHRHQNMAATTGKKFIQTSCIAPESLLLFNIYTIFSAYLCMSSLWGIPPLVLIVHAYNTGKKPYVKLLATSIQNLFLLLSMRAKEKDILLPIALHPTSSCYFGFLSALLVYTVSNWISTQANSSMLSHVFHMIPCHSGIYFELTKHTSILDWMSSLFY